MYAKENRSRELDRAILNEDVYVNDALLYKKGHEVSALEANRLFHKKKQKTEYICIGCGIPLICAKESAILSNMKDNEKNPYFKQKKKDLSHSLNCKYKLNATQSSPIDNTNIHRQDTHYSKLIEPKNNQENIDKNHLNLNNIDKIKDRFDSNTSSALSSFAEEFLACHKKHKGFTKDFYNVLKNLKLKLPDKNLSNYSNTFINVQWHKIRNKQNIYYGYLSDSYLLNDGILLVFSSPKNQIPNRSIPLFVFMPRKIFSGNIEKSTFLEQKFLASNHFLFVCGTPLYKNNYRYIIIDYMEWICMKPNPMITYKNKVKIFKLENKTFKEMCFILTAKTNKNNEGTMTNDNEMNINLPKDKNPNMINQLTKPSSNKFVIKTEETIEPKENDNKFPSQTNHLIKPKKNSKNSKKITGHSNFLSILKTKIDKISSMSRIRNKIFSILKF